jgi:CBS domain-containing protein
LILEELLPLARAGLRGAGVDDEDIGKYLGIIEERTRSAQTGARWIVKSLVTMPEAMSRDVRQRKLTAAMLDLQKQGRPVHEWPLIEATATEDWAQGYRTVGQFMSTDLFTVRPDDLIDLAASVMDWRHVRHVPVEDEAGRLVGLVTHRGLLRMMSNGNCVRAVDARAPVKVSEIMIENPVSVSPSTSSLEAMEIMRQHRIGCLPVIEADQLVGIVTSYDFLAASAALFKQHLSSG